MLITGGAGFIGANFVRAARHAEPGATLIVLDALTYAGNAENLSGVADIVLVEGDICDTDLATDLLKRHALDTIVHFAAESHVDRSITGPDAFVETNIIGTHSLLKAARAAWSGPNGWAPHRFHHISTDEVFGSLEADDPAFSETTPYAPNSPYSASKAASDHLVRAYHHTFGLATTMTNCSNNYGPYQFPEKLIPLFIINALNGRNLPVYGDGMNVRDWLHVEDHCAAIRLVIDKGRVGETYNVGGGVELPNLAIIDAICGAVDRAFAEDAALKARFPDCPAARGEKTIALKTFVKDRAGHDRRYAIDERKIARELGYKPAKSFQAALQDTVRWYLANQAWWEAILKRSH
jgi:dTDP-glucose 4,6-dehydratase